MKTETWVKLREMLDKTGYTEDGIIMCIVGVMQEQQVVIKQQEERIKLLETWRAAGKDMIK